MSAGKELANPIPSALNYKYGAVNFIEFFSFYKARFAKHSEASGRLKTETPQKEKKA